MECSVPLAQLPQELTFPKQYADRIRFDVVQHRLYYRGFMRKPDYDALARLSGDLPYLDALQELFRLATCAPKCHRQWRKPAVVMAGVLAIVLGLVGWFVQTRNGKSVPGGTSSIVTKQP